MWKWQYVKWVDLKYKCPTEIRSSLNLDPLFDVGNKITNELRRILRDLNSPDTNKLIIQTVGTKGLINTIILNFLDVIRTGIDISEETGKEAYKRVDFAFGQWVKRIESKANNIINSRQNIQGTIRDYISDCETIVFGVIYGSLECAITQENNTKDFTLCLWDSVERKSGIFHGQMMKLTEGKGAIDTGGYTGYSKPEIKKKPETVVNNALENLNKSKEMMKKL